MQIHHAIPIAASALVCAVLIGCGPEASPVAPAAVLATRGTERPFTGSCAVTIAPRVHDDGESCDGSDGHVPGEDDGGGPPIGRHFDVAGTCQVSHLGRTAVTGRLNIAGPFGGGHGEEALVADAEEGHGQLAVRGRLVLVAANGDQLASTYIPLTATFAEAASGDGGTLDFTATERIGGSCTGHTDGNTLVGGTGSHDDPVSSGRFAGAVGEATLGGQLRIGANDHGTGRLTITNGFLSY